MRIDRTISTDVLIVGAGGAALRAAVAACEAGARVALVVKGKVGRSGATVSPDSASVAWQVADDCSSSDDSPEVHSRNIIDAGLGMADPELARILAYETVDETQRLESWGLRFIADPHHQARHYSGYSCFGDRPRAHGIANSGFGHAGDIVRVLITRLRDFNLDIHEDVMVTDLVVEDSRCAGALGLAANGELVAFRAGAVILGTGGARQIFPQEPGRTRIDTTGDSYAMALRAGAELANMEFTQYMLHPVKPFPLSVPGVFWALCPTLRNSLGEDALAPYLPAAVSTAQVMRLRTEHYPFSTRDCSMWLDVAIANELRAGRGSPDGGLYLDFSRVDPRSFIPSRPQHIPEDFTRAVQLPSRHLQIRPAAHAVNGGVLINRYGESSVSGLFALAEAAAGPHGADRLGGCMVSNGQVFGARAGREAAIRAMLCRGSGPLSRTSTTPALERLQRHRRSSADPEYVLAALQQVTGRHLIVARNQRGLASLVGSIRELSGELARPSQHVRSNLPRALEVANALATAELMSRAALLRTESRGSHYREDFPNRDDKHWNKCIIFRQNDSGLTTEARLLGSSLAPTR